MKLTLLKLTAFLLILAGVLTSCDPPVEPVEIEYTISPASLNFDATGGEAGFTVSFKSPAVVESIDVLDTWCQVSTSGVSPVSVTVTVAPNTINEVRNTSVEVNMKSGETKATATVEITQESACIFDNPLTDLPWLKARIDELQGSSFPIAIYQCVYGNEETGFLEVKGDSGFFYNCNGDLLCIIGGWAGETCSELNIDLENKVLIWNTNH